MPGAGEWTQVIFEVILELNDFFFHYQSCSKKKKNTSDLMLGI